MTETEEEADTGLPAGAKEALVDQGSTGIRGRMVQVVAAWVLRVGVAVSVLVMVVALGAAIASHSLPERRAFSTDLPALRAGLAGLRPFAFMELGILLLVFTPVMRVAASAAIFAVIEHDPFYTATTLLVLTLTLASIFWVR